MMKDCRHRRVDLPIARSWPCVWLQFAGCGIDLGLPDLAQFGCAEVLEQWCDVCDFASSLHIAEGCFGERPCHALAMHGLGQEFGMPQCKDFFRRGPVANASAFVNADAAEGPADVPVRRTVSLAEFEGQGRLSTKAVMSCGSKK